MPFWWRTKSTTPFDNIIALAKVAQKKLSQQEKKDEEQARKYGTTDADMWRRADRKRAILQEFLSESSIELEKIRKEVVAADPSKTDAGKQDAAIMRRLSDEHK